MKITYAIVWLILGAGALGRAETSAVATGPVSLSAGKVEVVGLKPLMVTSLNFPKGARIDDIKIGSKIVQVAFDPKKKPVGYLSDGHGGDDQFECPDRRQYLHLSFENHQCGRPGLSTVVLV
jgi:hypothetical protein